MQRACLAVLPEESVQSQVGFLQEAWPEPQPQPGPEERPEQRHQGLVRVRLGPRRERPRRHEDRRRYPCFAGPVRI